jgi:hypothetical protein
MVEKGLGRRDSNLITRYTTSHKIIDGECDFEMSYKLDLVIPNNKIINGEWYRTQFVKYLHSKYDISESQEYEESILQNDYIKNNRALLDFSDDYKSN